MPRASTIRGWDRRHCDACDRTRVHYRVGLEKDEWWCIGTLSLVSDIVAPHGKRRNAMKTGAHQ